MLAPEHLATVEATAPALAEHGGAITRHFYRHLLADNPELAPMFSPAHQRSGNQQRALADAILAFAANIRDLERLGPAVERIGHKHAALGVRPEHYPIVGGQLLRSIQAVLGDAVDEAVLQAWGAAYQVLADVLCSREGELYAEQQRDHGWTGFRALAVVDKVVESDCITSFVLADPDGQPLQPARAGQYVTLRLPDDESGTTLRTYSLSAWDESGRYRISVKREPAPTPDVAPGYGSGYLHDRIEPGARLEVGPPIGEFVLADEGDSHEPLVLLSGGVGITPVLAMLQHAALRHRRRPIVFVHGARTRASLAFESEVRAAAERHGNTRVHIRLSEDPEAACDSHGFVDAELVRTLVPSPRADFFVCGPSAFMEHVQGLLRAFDVPEHRVRTEAFGPLASTSEVSVR